MGQASGTRVLRASEFIVSDAAGKRRASLGLIGNQPALNLYGSDGTVQVAVDLRDQGNPQIKLYRDGKTRIELGLGYLL